METTARHALFERRALEVVEPVRRYLARRTDHATAEDVFAEVMLVLWRRLDEAPDDLAPWIYRVASNCLANAQRGARRQLRLATRIAAVDPPREASPEEPSFDEVHDALARMRPADAELLRLWAWEQLTPTEIAVVLDINPNAAGVRLHRARQKFEEQLRKPGAGPGHERVTEGRRT
ncbi:sigma-70 family RNA polymerase sigma factor [Nocardioides humilatus]|uniref:Sigma-70 family RNA polymerase sigma factor n=1 Tax=Nocardioides humilatus TaxID=2607660 RepID=A0A5B1L8A1_9ACTN|nr:sigma-70 family RNA polymerase sigma factor [Nocardioides humilatus]KAA1416923.1 sigma-70 family RNA polymerase sigma factor [Nocardioides humilatus]